MCGRRTRRFADSPIRRLKRWTSRLRLRRAKLNAAQRRNNWALRFKRYFALRKKAFPAVFVITYGL
jgi:hypothetical protein